MPPPPPPPAAVPAAEPSGPLRAVFHLSEPGRAPSARGLTNALNALKALGDEPARFVLVVHGPAVEWLRRGEPENLGAPLAALLATGKVELRVCGKTLEENHWQLGDLLPGAAVVPSGTLEVLRLQRAGYAYFRP
jgi:intracellular sulfur oxidation DsrE/DsrF family protein